MSHGNAMAPIAALSLLTLCPIGVCADEPSAPSTLGSAIFIHPDGASAATWTAARALLVGPDADLQWDLLPHVALYRGHLRDCLTATSNGGATVHAHGVKVETDAFGMTAGNGRGRPIIDGAGRSTSVAGRAMEAGLRVGLVQSGVAVEPGTACFVVECQSRENHADIAAQLIESGVHVILAGGERDFLPEGVVGAHGPGRRHDGRNLVEEARARGYTVVYSRDELLSLPDSATRVLGLFAGGSTFNDRPEEDLAAAGLPLYDPEAPTVGEMTRAALGVLGRGGSRFLLVVEEEGTDNFGNNNNARGVFEACRRADEAIGVAREHLRTNPETLLITAADSDAGGMRMLGLSGPGAVAEALPARTSNGSPIDGREGTGSAPFLARPDRFGNRLPFAVVWAAHADVSGGILVRAEGLNAERVRGSLDNTDIPGLIGLTLLGEER